MCFKRAIAGMAAFVFVGCSFAASSRPRPQPRIPSDAAALRTAQDAIGSLRSLQPESARTRVFVLATFHLKQIQKEFEPAMLDPLLAKLREFRPDAVCIESLPGARVRELELRREAGPLYKDLLDGFASRHLRLAKSALLLVKGSPETAALKVGELLSPLARTKPEERTPEAHATLALWMAAAYEPVSAALQWSYLSDEQKRAQTIIPADLAADLDAACAEVNEDFVLSLPLARRLGLPAVDPVDDFEDLEAYARIDAQLEKDFQGNPLLASVSKAPIYAESDALRKKCLAEGDLWPEYALLNSARFAEADVEAQWGVFLRTHFASGTDRARLGLWENRNLKIAARIRAVAALNPGGRVLVIYGAAHKPFLDDYLSRMADINVVQLEALETSAGAGRARGIASPTPPHD
jgi:hypothetical protein